jgi:very-short-patch-repair endonuclease
MGRKPRIPPELTLRPFSLQEARAAGVTLDALRRKSWRRLGSEIYCWAGLAEDHWRLLAAWRGQLPPDAAFAGLTSAWLHRLDVDPVHPVEVVVPPGSGVRSRPGLVVRHGRAETVAVRGLPATKIQETFRDLRRRLAPVEYLVLADRALRLKLGRFSDLAEPAESPMETRLRWLLIQSGLPRPEVQRDLRDTDGRFIGRADLYYAQADLVIEYDGANHRERLIEDNRRQNHILNAGFHLLRFTAGDVNQSPDSLVAQVRVALTRV